MSTWIRASVYVGNRFKVFVLTRHDAVNMGIPELLEACRRMDDPDTIEIALRAVLLEHRPILSGCVIESLSFNHATYNWEVGVSHASLPRVAMFEAAPREQLIPPKVPPLPFPDE